MDPAASETFGRIIFSSDWSKTLGIGSDSKAVWNCKEKRWKGVAGLFKKYNEENPK
jgi:hypothetical protein